MVESPSDPNVVLFTRKLTIADDMFSWEWASRPTHRWNFLWSQLHSEGHGGWEFSFRSRQDWQVIWYAIRSCVSESTRFADSVVAPGTTFAAHRTGMNGGMETEAGRLGYRATGRSGAGSWT